jgi:hypothetical protein
MIQESRTDTIEIHRDFDAKVVEEMLVSLYTGELHAHYQMTLELFQIASIYEIKNLKEMCEIFIEDNLNVETATEILVLSCLHNAKLLRCKVTYFIKR